MSLLQQILCSSKLESCSAAVVCLTCMTVCVGVFVLSGCTIFMSMSVILMQQEGLACSIVVSHITVTTLALSRTGKMCVLGWDRSACSLFLWLCARYWVPCAQSEGGSAADQPSSAETRSAASYWDTGKVRLICFLFSFPLRHFSANFITLYWTCLDVCISFHND